MFAVLINATEAATTKAPVPLCLLLTPLMQTYVLAFDGAGWSQHPWDRPAERSHLWHGGGGGATNARRARAPRRDGRRGLYQPRQRDRLAAGIQGSAASAALRRPPLRRAGKPGRGRSFYSTYGNRSGWTACQPRLTGRAVFERERLVLAVHAASRSTLVSGRSRARRATIAAGYAERRRRPGFMLGPRYSAGNGVVKESARLSRIARETVAQAGCWPTSTSSGCSPCCSSRSCC